VVIELRKDSPILCFKTKQDGVTWQSGSIHSSSRYLLRHAIIIKAMLLAVKEFEARDFLKCDLFKALLPFATRDC
jgi:hypothetical protein